MKEQNNDEIDLIFVIKQSILALKTIYKNIIYDVLLILLFFKKNLIKLIIGSIIGGSIGYGLKIGLPPTYSSQMLVKPNFNTTNSLYNEIDFINRLLEEKDTNSHYGNLGIGERFFSIKKIEIYPLINNKEEQYIYQKYLTTIDTNITSQIPSFTEFSKNLEKTDFNFHYIKIYSKERIDFTILSKPIIQKLNNSPYFDNIQKETIKAYKNEIIALENVIKQYLSLQQTQKMDSTQSHSSIVYIGNNESDIVELYDRQIQTQEKITQLYEKISSDSKVLNIVSDFDSYGKKIKTIRLSWSIIIGFLGTLMILLLIKLNTKLNAISED